MKIEEALWIVKNIATAPPVEPAPDDPDSWVYMFYSAGLVKIGTTTDLTARLSNIRVTSATPVSVIWAAPGGKRFETTLHREFKADRVRGEWFRPSDDIRAFLRAMDESPADEAMRGFFDFHGRLEGAERLYKQGSRSVLFFPSVG